MQAEEIRTALKEERFADAVEVFVKKHQHVSFVEIEDLLSGYMPTTGDQALHPASNPALIAWVSSKEVCDVVQQLLHSKRIFMHPSSALVYAIDGRVPQLPVATHVSMQTDHWLPAVLCTFPFKRSLSSNT